MVGHCGASCEWASRVGRRDHPVGSQSRTNPCFESDDRHQAFAALLNAIELDKPRVVTIAFDALGYSREPIALCSGIDERADDRIVEQVVDLVG